MVMMEMMLIARCMYRFGNSECQPIARLHFDDPRHTSSHQSHPRHLHFNHQNHHNYYHLYHNAHIHVVSHHQLEVLLFN